jgi:xylulokinase
LTHLGIDLGTGSLKLMAVTSDGCEFSISRPYAVSAPNPGYAETDSSLWMAALKEAVSCLPDTSSIASIGLSGQMHGIVPVSYSRGVLYPAILWADQRGKSETASFLSLRHEMQVRLRNAPAAGMSATTMLWLKKNRKDIWDATDVFLFPKDYIRLVLTGEVATDYSDASGSLLYDFETGGWYGDLLDTLGLDEGKLPPICSSAASAGRVTSRGSLATGLPEGIPVAVGAGDTPAAIHGSGLEDEKSVQISIGTGAQIVRLCRDLPAFDPAINLFESARAGIHYRMAAMLNGGLALDWVRGIIGLSWETIYGEIGKRNGDKPYDLLFLPYLTGERTPYMNSEARGSWNGLALHHGQLELIHSAMMGVACSVRLGLESLGTEGISHYRLVGGSSRYPYWNELLASMLNVTLEISSMTDSSARGAVRLGASSTGIDISAPAEYSVIEPRHDKRMDDYYSRFTETYRLLSSHAS